MEFCFIDACEKGNVDDVKDLLEFEDCYPKEALDQAFRVVCTKGFLEVVQLLLKEYRYLDVHANNESAFIAVCAAGQQEIVQLLLSLKDDRYVDIHANNESAFIAACAAGQQEIVQLLLSLKDDRYVNIHANNESAFIAACAAGQQEIVQLLLSLKDDRYVDIHANNESAFIEACAAGQQEIVQLLLALKDDRNVDIHANDEAAFCRAYSNFHSTLDHVMISRNGSRIDPYSIIEIAHLFLSASDGRRIRGRSVYRFGNLLQQKHKRTWRAAAVQVFLQPRLFKSFSHFYCVKIGFSHV